MKSSNVVTLMRFNTLGEAEIIKALLESSGITCSLTSETIQSILPSITGGESPIQLLVAEEDAAKARKILDAHFDQEEFDKATGTKPRKSCCKKKE